MRFFYWAFGLCLITCHLAFGAICLKNGKIIDAQFVPTESVQEHYQHGLQAVENRLWNEAVKQFQIVVINFPETRYAQEAHYYLGIGYFYLGDYDLANQQLTRYLQELAHPKHFKDALYYKFAIGEKFSQGARRHLFGMEVMPKWLTSRELALSIFDEVATSLPNDEIAAKALFAKGILLCKMCLYKESIEAFQTVIKRFPKNPLAPDSYLEIAKLYVYESAQNANDPDLLGLAQVNLKRFRHDFPGDERIKEAEAQYVCMQERSAEGLYELGRFYEKTYHPRAAVLYYLTTLNNFPETYAARMSRFRLERLCPECLESFPAPAQ